MEGLVCLGERWPILGNNRAYRGSEFQNLTLFYCQIKRTLMGGMTAEVIFKIYFKLISWFSL